MPRISEFDIQRALCIYLDKYAAPGVVWWHTPNGGARDAREGARFKQIGVKPGIPDLLFLRAGRLYCLEIKDENGRQSLHQRDMQETLTAAGAAVYEVARSLTEAKDFCRRFMLTVTATDGNID